MPVHYDPARIRKRFCPRGHDKYVVGVQAQITGRRSECNQCYNQFTTNAAWGINPRKAINASLRRIRKRRGRKIEQIKELLAQLEGETNA